MMNRLIILYALFAGTVGFGQTPQTIKFDDLKRLMSEKSDKIQVLNFWATWCGPCVKELPLFERLNTTGGSAIQVTLVSLDLDLDPDPEKVYKFVSKKEIRSQVLLLDEPDPNSWINQVDKSWTGALPATLLINQKTGKRKFIGKALQEGELEKYIQEVQ